MSEPAYYTEGLAEDLGYDENSGSIDALIDYKNALEETLDSIEAKFRADGVTLSEWLTQSVAG